MALDSRDSSLRMKRWTHLSLLVAAVAVLLALGKSGLVRQWQPPAHLSALLQQPLVASVVGRVRSLAGGIGGGQPQASRECPCKSPNPSDDGAAACQLQGTVTDCCCSYAAVERVNRDSVQPLLTDLVQTPFFRYFKVDLYCECPLWPEDGMCSLRDCSVCECEPQEVPEPWRQAEGESCDSAQRESDVDRTLTPHVKAKLLSVRDWRGFNNPWMPDSDAGVEYAYINLRRNPERYTGYKGEHANRVWAAIYEQPCFADITHPDTCAEKRVFYKLISGIHSSVSAHIVGDYLLDQELGIWGPNLEMFKWRLGNPAVKDRVENLYFTYLFVLRAALKAGPILKEVDFDTGLPEEDAVTKALVKRLVDNAELQSACPVPFDEGRLWKGADSADLKLQLQKSFQNITTIMDCVGCEKCKMWGKLQLLGIATSLKILFSAEDCLGGSPDGLQLERNEVIALFNLLERLSMSVEIVRSMSLELVNGSKGAHPGGLGAIQDVTQQPLPSQLRAA